MLKRIFILAAAGLISFTLQAQLPKLPKKVKDIKEKVEEAKSSTTSSKKESTDEDDDPLEVTGLKNDIRSVKDHLAEGELDFAASSLKLAKQSLNTVKRKFPDMDVSSYEKEIQNLEKAINSKQDKISSKADAIAFIRSAAYDCKQIIPQDYYDRMYSQFKNDAERFYKKCSEASYTQNKTKIDTLLIKYPDLKTTAEIKDDIDLFYNRFPAEFNEFISFLIKEANYAIEKAYADKKNNSMVSATENAEIAVLLSKSILSIVPTNANGLRIKKEAEKISGTVDDAKNGSVYTSTYHKENAGKFIFSKNPVVLNQETNATAANAFTLKDHIYGMAYLKGTIKDLTDGGTPSQTEMQVTLFIDGNELGSFNYNMTKEMEGVTAFPFEILPDPNTAKDCAGAVNYAKLFSQASPREHELKFRFSAIYMSWRRDLCEGTCTIDLSEGQEALDNLSALYKKRAVKNVFLPKAAMKNPVLENEMLSATKGMLTRMNWQGTPMKAVIIEDGWTVYHHPITGIVTDRKINGAVSVKLPNGTCKVYRITFIQDYNGNYGKTQTHSTDNGTDIDCENAQK